MQRKNLAIIILVILIITSGYGSIILGMPYSVIKSFASKNVLKIACSSANSPAVLDPVDSWPDVSNDIIRHVCDTLLAYDLTDPALPLEMRLATSYSWNIGMDELTISLKDDVWFHDGAKFNATAVKFTFDRIMYFINSSGDLPGNTHVCDPASLFYDMHGDSILNRTEVIDEYTVKFVLNKPNGIFLSLLSYEACSILHPNTVDATEYLILGEDILVGTGPFKYIHLIVGDELKFERWDLYWGSNVFWDEIVWEYFHDSTTTNNALLDNKADYLYGPLNSYITSFQAEEDIVVVEMNTSNVLRFWAINNERLNDTRIRKAMSYAYNYSRFIDQTRQGHAVKAEQLLPPGFPYYNASFKAPYYNTTIAREIMMKVFPNKTAGLTVQAYGENDTNDAAWSALRLAEYYVLEHVGWIVGIEMNFALASDMEKVGIEIYPYDPNPWGDPNILIYDWDKIYRSVDIWYADFAPDYLEPFNILEPLLGNISKSRSLYYIHNNDYLLQKWLNQYEDTNPINTTRRTELIYKIQQRTLNELYVFLPLSFDKTYYVHHRSVGDISYNIMNNLWLTDSYYIPGIPTI
ncbi:MAG: ABC transporter substrate-binding protein [Candidatus Thorarchaeota archaeon]